MSVFLIIGDVNCCYLVYMMSALFLHFKVYYLFVEKYFELSAIKESFPFSFIYFFHLFIYINMDSWIPVLFKGL